MKNIDEVVDRLYRGDSSNEPVKNRAKELFQQAFHIQQKQKEGVVAMKRSGKKQAEKLNRQKFSKRKQYVVAALYRSFQEHQIHCWTIPGKPSLAMGHGASDARIRAQQSDGRHQRLAVFCRELSQRAQREVISVGTCCITPIIINIILASSHAAFSLRENPKQLPSCGDLNLKKAILLKLVVYANTEKGASNQRHISMGLRRFVALFSR